MSTILPEEFTQSMSSKIEVFFIQKGQVLSVSKTNNIAVSSGNVVRLIKPTARSSGVSAISRENEWSPIVATGRESVLVWGGERDVVDPEKGRSAGEQATWTTREQRTNIKRYEEGKAVMVIAS